MALPVTQRWLKTIQNTINEIIGFKKYSVIRSSVGYNISVLNSSGRRLRELVVGLKPKEAELSLKCILEGLIKGDI